MNKRTQWASNLGFILATTGAAIGLGNLWKFPYLMGKNGGFFFLIAYLFFVIVLGLPIMIAEMAIGRKTQQSPVNAYRSINKKVTIVGILGIVSAFIIVSYYSVIGGWLLKYITSYATTLKAPADFNAYIAQPIEPIVYHFVFMFFACLICVKGTKGIEKASKIMMPALFIIIIVIMVRSLTLGGAKEGLSFIFNPSGSKFQLSSVTAALGQVFYSLSLCMGITITYGSYLNKKENIPKNCTLVAGIDTGIAILAGIAIFPAVFAFGLAPEQGPSLIFGTLPNVFSHITGGAIFAILFFVLMFFAALTSAIALVETVAAYVIDDWGWGRKKAVWIIGIAAFLLGIPSSLSFGALRDFKILNYNFFDLLGMITDNILLPIGGIIMCIFIGWIWGPKHLIEHMEEEGNYFKFKKAWILAIRFITPILVGIVTVVGFISVYNVIKG